MTVHSDSRRSPLHAWQERLAELAPAVHAAERPFTTALTVRVGEPDVVTAVGSTLGVALPEMPCTFTRGSGAFGPVAVLWLGPDEYLVLAPPGMQSDLEPALRRALGPAPGAVVDTSAQRTQVNLSGPRVRDILAHGCALDLHSAVAPSGTCVQTLLGRTGIILMVGDAAHDEFALLVRSSFAGYFATWLIDACTEYRASESVA